MVATAVGPSATADVPTVPASADDSMPGFLPPKQQQLPAVAGPAEMAAAAFPTPQSSAEAAPAALPPPPQRKHSVVNSPKGWLYELVTCPFLFKPCPQCCATNSGREVLITYFDTDNPTHGFCTYCPQRHGRPHLLQIRRSTYHEVVKAADVSRLTDVSGIQHYVINGAKVLFLRPRPQPRPPKGVVAPARCAVDGRQLMDAHSTYCSLRCKLEVEDVAFAANYPSAAEEMQAVGPAGSADGSAAAASALAGTYHRQGGHEGRRVVVFTNKRQATPAAAAAAGGGDVSHRDDSSEDAGDAADGSWGARHKRARHMPSKFANAVVGGSYQAAVGGASVGRSGGQQHRASSSNKARDDTVCDQAAALLAAAADGTPLSLAGLAGLHMLQKGTQAASPCGSDDSGRSSTCNQHNQRKRKKGLPPSRAPMQ